MAASSSASVSLQYPYTKRTEDLDSDTPERLRENKFNRIQRQAFEAMSETDRLDYILDRREKSMGFVIYEGLWYDRWYRKTPPVPYVWWTHTLAVLGRLLLILYVILLTIYWMMHMEFKPSSWNGHDVAELDEWPKNPMLQFWSAWWLMRTGAFPVCVSIQCLLVVLCWYRSAEGLAASVMMWANYYPFLLGLTTIIWVSESTVRQYHYWVDDPSYVGGKRLDHIDDDAGVYNVMIVTGYCIVFAAYLAGLLWVNYRVWVEATKRMGHVQSVA